MDFINQHRHRLENFTYNARGLFSGSFSEIPIVYFISKPADFDFMLHCANVCAVPRSAQSPTCFVGEILTIDPQSLPPGYVTLKNSKNICYKHLKTYYDNTNGPALQTPVGWSTLTFDCVLSVQCPYWPPEAQKWRTRHRPYGWPSKDLIDQVVSDGCFLIGKSHPNHNDDDGTQWRYSFSKAEMRLISSWTDNQKYVYHVLRLIKSEFVKKYVDHKAGFCTYHLKTQMFWACEEKSAEFWEDSNLLSCICQLLTEMEQRFSARNFPNYFLRDCNIADGNFIANDFSEAIRMLTTQFDRSILESLLPPRVCMKCRLFAAIPVKMAPFVYLQGERFGVPFLAHCPMISIVQALIDEELDNLMNGIYNMQLGKALGQSHYSVAEQCFLKGIPRPETVNNDNKMRHIALEHSASLNALTALYESLGNAKLLDLQEGENQWDLSVMISCTMDHCPYAGMSWKFPWKEEEHGKFYEKFMNPTHLPSAAYLCNLYFMIGNYWRCIETVQEQITLAVNAFNSELFPMVFCPEVASLFDETIQEVLGFLWLLKHLLGGKRIFEFSTCPHLYMLYIGMQSSLRLDDQCLKEHRFEFNVHREKCRPKYRLYLYSCHYVLLDTTWRNCERRWDVHLYSDPPPKNPSDRP